MPQNTNSLSSKYLSELTYQLNAWITRVRPKDQEYAEQLKATLLELIEQNKLLTDTIEPLNALLPGDIIANLRIRMVEDLPTLECEQCNTKKTVNEEVITCFEQSIEDHPLTEEKYLQCDNCQSLQHHLVGRTIAQSDWEKND